MLQPVKTLNESRTIHLRFAALSDFLQAGAAGGAVLIVSAIAALVWANSPAGDAYHALHDMLLLHETVLVWITTG